MEENQNQTEAQPSEVISEVASPIEEVTAVPEHVPEEATNDYPKIEEKEVPPEEIKAPENKNSFFLSLHQMALDAIWKRRRQKLEKIMIFALGEKKKGKPVTNDDVQMLLRVSDTTAARYLGRLVKEGRLTRTGEKKGITYEFLA